MHIFKKKKKYKVIYNENVQYVEFTKFNKFVLRICVQI